MSTNSHARAGVEIQGAVQGVGFRPFVYRLAIELGLAGWVINDTRGVFIEVEGPAANVECFLQRLPGETPPRAIVQSIRSEWLPPAGYERFEIRHSDGAGPRTVLVLPDIATCDDCKREIFDPADRRRNYPFTNCTNCGPRFSIIRALPYDRPNTTMTGFVMCPECRREYEEPLDRRFHAQPNACRLCGPVVWCVDGARGADHEGAKLGEGTKREGVLCAAEILRAGKILALKGLGGFHLVVDARDEHAVARLRERKRRGDKPFAVMAPDLEWVREHCEVTPEAESLLQSAEAPVVLLPKTGDAGVAVGVAPGNPTLGVMLPYTPLHHLLMRELGFPVVATSGNLTDEPICIANGEAMERLGHIADAFLLHDRPIERHVDDSVAWIVAGAPRLLRRARGYAPLPVLLPRDAPTILAVGAHLKNTVALSVGRQAFISQHIGDLETPEALGAFERVIVDFLRLYEAQPVAVAHDLHPDYLSTQFAAQLAAKSRLPLIGVQHHHAHLAACLAENDVEGPALGITWDGTGLGTDGTIWGGEFLLGDAAGYERVAQLRPFRLPGGDAAVHEPRRVALALLWELYDEPWKMTDLGPVDAFGPSERRLIFQMLDRNVHAPVTTSMGRLFDAVAALAGLQQEVDYEGQAAMHLEFAADPSETAGYPLDVLAGSPIILDWEPLVRAVIDDMRRKTPVGTISARFHNALIDALVSVAGQIGAERVALTGGCFQNRLLTERAAERLSAAGHRVILHRQVPPNDGGVALGQVAVAAAQLRAQPSLGCQALSPARYRATASEIGCSVAASK
jgi:hydrogenase maturation protein HypF